MAAATVAIITRTKDRPVFLKRAVKSVLSQTASDWTHVIVNDGGDPVLVDTLLAKYRNQYGSRLVLIHNPVSVGMEAASNVGIHSSDSRYIAIHDDDDSWSPYFLETMVRAIQRERERFGTVRGVICHSLWVIETIKNDSVYIQSMSPYNDWIQAPLIDLDRLILSNVFPPISFLFEREAANEVDLFDETLPVLGDWDFNLKFCMKYDIAVVREALAFYHHRPTAKGVDGNSVITSEDKHLAYRCFLKNRWLRRDLQNAGLGIHLAQREFFEFLSTTKSTHHRKDRTFHGFSRVLRGKGRGTTFAELVKTYRSSGWPGLKRLLRDIGT